ncbi:hypothetical protein PFICI_14267 [Pestalotiopsis fici W106-1]|uniref:Uncharacterized protein n=1 Tax=Pestalotiopsis fici (strain W106-1 / CGMCC3.15140) TaxID=1229662 RepID=W3WNK4_PESFW|nr:uncharacterized protein PFICI_14267 [Pestalotiopsis fici W106-1]ETS74401.1 hypothetical protein PFICI_14267 [Pestalotiopsis fici W106-1]
MRSSTDDVTIIPKPREDWKPVQRRQASRYPEGVYEQDRYLVHKNDFVTQSQGTDRQSSTTHPKHEQSRFKAVRRASSNSEVLQDAHSGVYKHFLRPPHRPSTSDSPASALLRPRSKLSGEHPEIRTTGTTPTSARQGSSAIHDITPIESHFPHRPQTPKAGFLGHWLGMLSNKAPPSRAVTPSEDLEEVTLIIPTEEVIAARRQCPSNVTTASRGSKRSHQTEHTFSSDHPISFEGDPHRPVLGQRGSWFTSRRKSSPSLGKSQKKTLTPAKNDSIMSRRTSREKTAKGKSSDISQAGSGGP